MAKKFLSIEDVKKARRKGDSLYSIYEQLSQSQHLLKQQKQNAFDILGTLYLYTLDLDTAKELANFPINALELNQLQHLQTDVAKTLSQWKGYYLYLNGLTKFSSWKIINQGKIPYFKGSQQNELRFILSLIFET